jgi:cadmium resistance protein CadD (predicted permease)
MRGPDDSALFAVHLSSTIDQLTAIPIRILQDSMLESVISTAGAAAVIFVATNIDDLVVLVGFFSDRKLKAVDVVGGQILGIAALVLISVVAAKASLLLPMRFVGLLGLIPIALGIRHLVRRNEHEADEEGAPDRVDASSNWRQILTIAVVTIANGGDNIGVYTPVFAVRSSAELLIMILMFALMTFIWCVACHWLVNHRRFGAPVQKLGSLLLPYTLLAIGVWVLYEADTVSLLR